VLTNSQKHPVPHRNAVRRVIEKFRETGSVLDAERSGRPSELNDKITKKRSLRLTRRSLRTFLTCYGVP
jgi:transposase